MKHARVLALFSGFPSMAVPRRSNGASALTHFFSVNASSSSSELLFEYNVENSKIPNPRTLSYPKCSEKRVRSTVANLRRLGFSDGNIASCVSPHWSIMTMNSEKILMPKLQFLQSLGLTGPDLVTFVTKNYRLLRVSLDGKLIPTVAIIRKVLLSDATDENVIKVLAGYSQIACCNINKTLVPSISYLESCGIARISRLLLIVPRMFTLKQSRLTSLVSRAVEMGFSRESGTFIHALRILFYNDPSKLKRKFDLFRSSGFSESEIAEMFRKCPFFAGILDDRLKARIDFFLNTCKIDRRHLVGRPSAIILSLERRMIPRYRVLQTLKETGLVMKDPSVIRSLCLREDKFLERFIFRFKDHTGELVKLYRGDNLDSI